MLNYQAIRARYELATRDALLPLDVPLHYDNVQEQPIPTEGSITEYATITISFRHRRSLTSAVVSSLFAATYRSTCTPQGWAGCSGLEQMAAAVVCALLNINEYPDPDNVITHVGGIQGPTPVLGGQDPQAATVVSAPFTARVFIP